MFLNLNSIEPFGLLSINLKGTLVLPCVNYYMTPSFLIIKSYFNTLSKNFRATVRLLTHSNTAINVFIYAGRHPDFKEIFVRYLQICFCRRRNKVTSDVDSEGDFVSKDIQKHPVPL